MRAQVSIEYLLVFGIAAVILVVAAIYFPQQLQNASNEEKQAQAALKELKQQLTTASLSNTHYQANITAPTLINNQPIRINITDNNARIINTRSKETLASTNTPHIDEINEHEEDIITIQKTQGKLILTLPKP